MVLCGTKNGSYMASLEEPFEATLFKSAPRFAAIEHQKWLSYDYEPNKHF